MKKQLIRVPVHKDSSKLREDLLNLNEISKQLGVSRCIGTLRFIHNIPDGHKDCCKDELYKFKYIHVHLK